MRIGLLEDNPSIVDWLSTALGMAGHSVSPYYDGPSLLAHLFATESISPTLPFDLLLVDLYLPGGISGLDVINRLRKAIPSEQFPIIVVSGASLSELNRLHASHPDIPVLQEPFRVGTLLEQIEMLSADRA